MRKPRILGILPHMPAFDSCFPLLERLHARGHVAARIITGPRIRETEPRIIAAIERSGVPCDHRSVLGMELLGLRDVWRADALLTHSDPILYGKKTRPRDAFLRATGHRVIFVQHGLVQMGLHYPLASGVASRLHADLALLWADLTPTQRDILADPPRIEVTGLLKRNRLEIAAPSPDFAERLSRAREVVLICHNYGHEAHRYPDTRRDAAFAAWRKVFAARPDTLFLVRSHRGRKIPEHDRAVGGLIEGFANVLVSDRHEGMMAFSTINDILAVSDRVVTHPSTVVLDALSEGVPVATIDNDLALLSGLPAVDDAGAFLDWLDSPDPMGGGRAFVQGYGDVDANLDRAARLIEAHIGAA